MLSAPIATPVMLDSSLLLVLNIIGDHFGEQTRDVATMLLNQRGCTLSFLVSRFCGARVQTNSKGLQTKESVCSSLLVLQQHGCLLSELPPDVVEAVMASASSGLADGARKRSAASIENQRVIYSIHTSMVLNRLRIGKLGYHVHHLLGFGRLGELVMEELFMNGRQSFQQLRADVDARASADTADDTLQGDDRFKNIQKTFDALVARGFIIKAEELQLKRKAILKLPPKTRGAKNKRHLQGSFGTVGSIKRGRGGDDDGDDDDEFYSGDEDDDDELPAEMRPQRNRARGESFLANRWMGDGEWKEDCGFGPITEEVIYDADRLARAKREAAEAAKADALSEHNIKIEDLTTDDLEAAPSKQSDESASLKKGANDATSGIMDVEDSDSKRAGGDFLNAPAFIDERGGLWMIGWDQLIVEELKNACVRYTTERMQAKAGRVVKIILDGSEANLQTPVSIGDSSGPLTLMAIFDEYKRKYPTSAEAVAAAAAATSASDFTEKTLDLPTLKKLIQLLIEDNILAETNTVIGIPALVGARESKVEYKVKVGEIIHNLKRKTFHSIAATRFGLSTARILELLLNNGELMEQQKLSDLAIMPGREARENLYKLYKDQWIDYRDVPKRNDYNPVSTNYYWTLDQNRIKAVVLDHCYKTVLNLRIRCVSFLALSRLPLVALILIPESSLSSTPHRTTFLLTTGAPN